MTEPAETIKPDADTVATTETPATTETVVTEKPAVSADATTETTSTETEVKTETTEQVADPAPTTDDQAAEADIRVVPEADKYVLPEGVPPQLAQFASQNDMTQVQLDNALQYFGAYNKASTDSQAQFLEKQGEEHTEKWGDQKEYNLALVRRALSQNDPDGTLKDMLNTTGYGNHPAVLDFFLKIGNSMKEGGFISGAVHTPTGGKKSAAQTLFGSTHPSAN